MCHTWGRKEIYRDVGTDGGHLTLIIVCEHMLDSVKITGKWPSMPYASLTTEIKMSTRQKPQTVLDTFGI